jgi:proteasome assembly chaperone (PAC2) family protein
MEEDIWINRYQKPELPSPVAVVGSPGLRSVGKLAVETLIDQTKATVTAELYSNHLPSIYQTKPSYAAHPSLPGMGGSIIENGSVDLPKIQFYAFSNPPLILGKGYHPNFEGQFTVAEKVLDYLIEVGVNKMIVVAGFGSKEKKVVCAAHSQEKLDEMKEKYGVGIGYKGPFLGFSGLVFGLAKLKRIEALCLFSATEPNEENLELPDKEASDRVVDLIRQMLNLPGQ